MKRSAFRQSARVMLITCAILLIASSTASAHVKWFADFHFTDPPLPLGEVLTPTFLALALLSIVAMGVAVVIDQRLNTLPIYQRVSGWLEARREYSTLALRIGAGMVLLLSWQVDSLLVPDLAVAEPWVGTVQFILALLLIFPQTTPIAGAGLAGLWAVGVLDYGLFYMLDYAVFVGAGVYLMVSQHPDRRLRGLGIPALYATLGFSLCWVAIEKWVYPEWGIYVLGENPQLALGLPLDFFLVAAGFIEFALGYLLIIGLLGRPLALVITLVFFVTTSVFGRTEIIGHTLIHAALIVFLLEGPGRIYPAPIDIHRRLPWRVAFASVNLALLLAILIVPYIWAADRQRDHALSEAITQAQIDDCAGAENPAVRVVELADGNTVTCDVVVDYLAESAGDE
jgi:uncharacterized membrane protein YphA (DoxX/SURF4 family)